MTERVKKLLSFYRAREYRKLRCYDTWDLETNITGMDEFALSAVFLSEWLQKQKPMIFDSDIFGFNRYMAKHPGIIVGNSTTTTVRGVEFRDRISNICPEYHHVIDRGIDSVLAEIEQRLPTAPNKAFLESAKAQLLAILELCDRYRDAAKAQGNDSLYNALCNVPRNRPCSFYEACLFQKILIFSLRCANHSHLPLGRFDQYMYPYFQADLDRGITKEALLETLELYFISLNFDTDLYFGIQAGDNGQSMVLGGYDLDGTDRFNELSVLCLDASEALCLIDPKLNIRVNAKTPNWVYAKGTRLTKQGLGFPQYCNDDVIVPGLIKIGYAPEDAANYAVAACWEPIIPGRGVDRPNRGGMNYPLAVMDALQKHLTESADFEDLMRHVDESIRAFAVDLMAACSGKALWFSVGLNPSPLLSLLMDGCLQKGQDASDYCLPYYNNGTFGIGISTAADSLAAVKKVVYDEGSVTAGELLQALHDNFEGHDTLRSRLLRCPKMGNDDDYVDSIAARLMDTAVDAINGKPNGVGGTWRIGTGSAQFYILSANNCPATPDGRKSGEPYGCSFSPAPGTRTNGPLSVIRSFTKRDLTDVINGGPLTMELHDNVFRNAMGEEKVAQLVKLFILSRGHQLQLNTINRELLLHAQQHPEEHPNLVVRVWGWSGYFCELDTQFQNHILSRTAHTF